MVGEGEIFLLDIVNFIEKNIILYILVQVLILVLMFILNQRFRMSPYVLFLYTYILESFYMIIRFSLTLDIMGWVNGIASVTLWLAEFWGYLQQGVFYLLMGKRKGVPHKFDIDYVPTVDFMVPTYSEPIDVLRRTLVACSYLDYPADKLKVYVLDDGGRQWVRNLTQRLGFIYIARTDHSHAKAGNLNNALQNSSGEIIVTIDADMVPKSFFLKRTVGYFVARNVAFVQSPQIFFNPDPFQHNLLSTDQVNNEQDFFMTEMEEAKDKFGAVMYVGSNTLFSRKALMSIGGFATGCITEDVATGMLLQAKGYRSIFVKEILAKGLSAESYSEMLHQRDRWARGNIQAAKIWNPLTIRGLTFMQRILYANGVQYWYFGIHKLIYILSPILFLDFHIKTLQATVELLLVIWLPKWIGSSLSFRVVSQSRRTTFWSHIYETAMAPYLAWSAIIATLGIEKKKGKKFRVTQKGIHSNSVKVVWVTFLTHFILFLMSIFGFAIFGTYSLVERGQIWYYVIIYFWTSFNLVGIILSLFISIEQPRPRKSERVKLTIPCTLMTNKEVFHGRSVDISETGALIEFEYSLIPESNQNTLMFDVDNFEPISVQVLAGGKRNDRVNFYKRVIFNQLSDDQYMNIVKLLFDQPETLNGKKYGIASKSGIIPTFQRATKVKLRALRQIVNYRSKNDSHGTNFPSFKG